MTNIIQKIIDNKNKIVGIKINGNFYDVDYVTVLAADDLILHCYITNTFTNVTEICDFTAKDIKAGKDIKLYRLEEI